MLDSVVWTDHVLPAMAPHLGIGVWQEKEYYPRTRDTAGRLISFDRWMALVDYYKAQAPKNIPPAQRPVPFRNDSFVFRLRKPLWTDSIHTAATGMVCIDSSGHNVFFAGALDNLLYRWNGRDTPVAVRQLPSPAVRMLLEKDRPGRAVLTCIGNMRAVDRAEGEVLELPLNGDPKASPVVIAGHLPRPVQAVPGDFNGDGRQDWVVCGFGHNRGGLFLLEQKADGGFNRKVLREVPGAEQAVVTDFNRDGRPDILALFAQADEGVWLFLNEGRGRFTVKNLLRFPPVFGSTSFQLTDVNKDGRPDILYTCGDNADYSQELKPFHGVYLFLNQGGTRYRQAWFYPVNGCTKAVAADMDEDGDVDIASIAFFGDLEHCPEETFICFEQDRPMHFIPHAIPVHASGRWISMDLGDLDGDGDPDIVLGNYSNGLIIQDHLVPDWNTTLPVILLENKSRMP
ncbi:hypothetical protein GCM10023143_09040 [Compostibacter hankyongensis]|uniref:VCBS repeat-containing protein n=2 Tax=Compostibacter hankyongensis TaxID=1007089 RepID=A0ABP8FIJ6_9BACT